MTARRRTVALSWVAARMAGSPAGIAEGAERGHRGLAAEGVVVVGGQPGEAGHDLGRRGRPLAARPGGGLDDDGLVVVEEGGHRGGHHRVGG